MITTDQALFGNLPDLKPILAEIDREFAWPDANASGAREADFLRVIA